MPDKSIYSSKLTALMKTLDQRDGPFVIIGRPHSGTRPVADAFMRNGFHMGEHITPGFLDSEEWFSFFALPMITSPFFPDWPELNHSEPGGLDDRSAQFNILCEQQLILTLKHFLPKKQLSTDAWGWKLSESLFLMPIIKHYFPKAKFIHLIRDGRDVALSDGGYFQLTSKPRSQKSLLHFVKKAVDSVLHATHRNVHRYDYRRFCHNISFGHSDNDSWAGIDLNDFEQISTNRYFLQMQSWKYCIETARQYGKEMDASYMEVKYEDFCHQPVVQMQNVFQFLGQPMASATEQFLQTGIKTGRIGKWHDIDFDKASRRDFDHAVQHGQDLLQQLGYMDKSDGHS